MNGWTATDMPDQSGRLVVITGANSGVGYESALAFARKGARVVMASRSLDKLEKARQDIVKLVPKAQVDVMALDLGSLKSVHAFADSFNSRYDRLDILMNNAGIMVPPFGKTAEGFESQFGTNHLGHFALTGLILPKLLQTPGSRIVTVSSSAAFLRGRIDFDNLQSEKGYRPMSAYGQSKLANILFADELQRKLEAIGAKVISVVSQPGYALTNLQSHSRPSLLVLPFWALLRRFMSQPADLGAQSQLYAATAADVRGGDFYGPKRMMLVGAVTLVKRKARGHNTADAARLWQVSAQLTGVDYAALGEKSVPRSAVSNQLKTA